MFKYEIRNKKTGQITNSWVTETEMDNYYEPSFGLPGTYDVIKTDISALTEYNSYYAQREKLLKDSDWAVLPDSYLTDECKAEYVTYRAALKMLRKTVTVDNVLSGITWPKEPIKVVKLEYRKEGE